MNYERQTYNKNKNNKKQKQQQHTVFLLTNYKYNIVSKERMLELSLAVNQYRPGTMT